MPTNDLHATDQRIIQHFFGRPSAVKKNRCALFDFLFQTVVEVIVHLLNQLFVRKLCKDDIPVFNGVILNHIT